MARPKKNVAVYVVVGASCLIVALCMWKVWDSHQRKLEESFTNAPEPIKRIRQMYSEIIPDKSDIPIREGNESYTMNKNSITLCLKNPNTGGLYSWNTLAYVSLHELAHVITKEKEKDKHGPIFTRNFLTLLKKAKDLGYYNPRQPIPNSYCGITN